MLMQEHGATAELLEAEKGRPYAKYYDWAHGPLDPDAVAAYEEGRVYTQEEATDVFHLADLLKPGYLPMEMGVCEMADGSGLFANRIRMPEVTPEMFAWFMAWFPLEDLRYKIWVPHAHYGAAVSDETRATLMDPQRAYVHKLRGTMRYIWEDNGAGRESMCLRMISPQEGGVDPALCPREPEQAFACLALGMNLDKKVNTILFHCIRALPEGGSELRSRFWMGYGMENGKFKLKLPAGVRLPRMLMRKTWEHNILEYSRLRDLLPRLYREFGDKPLDYGMDR